MALSGTISGAYRGYTLQTTWTAKQNTAGNYSDITAVHKLICDSTYALYIDGRTNSCTADGTAKTFTSGAISTAGGTTITLGTTSHRIYHNSDGTKTFTMTTVFNMQADIVGTWVSSITATGTITLNAIPRQAQITVASNFNDEQNPSFTFTNAGGFQLSAYLRFSDKRIDRSGLGNSTSGNYTFALTETERNALRNATPNSNTMTVIYGVATNISGTTYTYEVAKTMTIVNGNPTAPSLSYADTNATTTAITGNNQRIIRNKSILTATIGSSTAKKGATIKSYSTTINGATKVGNGSQSFGTINLATNGELITTVTDSRGNTATAKKTVIVDDWVTPIANVQLYRINNYETSSRLRVDCQYSSINGKNTITCQYCYKKTTDSSFSGWVTVANNTLVTINLDNGYDFNVKIRIQDKLSGWIEATRILPKGVPIFFIDVDKHSVSVNCLPAFANSFEVDGRISCTGAFSAGGDGIIVGNLFANGKRVYPVETGSWSPKMSALSESEPTISYDYQQGDYLKIGKMVFVAIYLRGRITKLNGTNNYACITNLPFTPKDYVGGKCALSLGTIYNALDITDNNDNLTAFINGGVIRLQRYNGAGATQLKVTPSGSYFVVGLSGIYEAQ